MSALQIAACRVRMRVHPGYARRWIRRNWFKAIAFTALLTAAVCIRQPIPCAACWIGALAVALSEDA